MVVTPTAKGASELKRVQFPFVQLYIGWPSLRVAKMVTLSPVAVAVPTLTAAEQLLSAFAVWLAGQLMIGGFVPVSSTVTIKLQLPPPVSEV